VRLGLYLTAQHPAHVGAVQAVREHAEQVALARDLGFSTVIAGQHFLPQPFWMIQTVPLLARIAAETGDMRVGTGIVLLTLLNPLEAAEDFASLDAITGGRFVAGVGLGYRPVENAAFGVGEGRAKLFEAKLDVVRRLLAGEAVTAEGPGFKLEGARLALRPERPLPIWVAGNSDAGVRRAARLGDTWFVNPHTRLDELERQVELFHVARSEAGRPPAEELPVAREVCVRRTDHEAMRVARPYIESKYASYVAWGQDKAMPADDTLQRDWDGLLAGDRFMIGSPETCAHRIRAYRERLGTDEIICRVQWPGMPQREVVHSLRLLGEQVLPAVA
jgi:alkanesulfonate monooxygenase SsuD/methylene tetrahydromethanopterin reductase-like flavin-dependent oxidoreductase (luciferase family)